MAKIPGQTTQQVLLDALKDALRALEDTRIVGPGEAKHIGELKQAIRSKIADLETPPNSIAAA